MVPSKTEWFIKKKRKQHEGYYWTFYCLFCIFLLAYSYSYSYCIFLFLYFPIFTTMLVILEIKISLVSIKKYFYHSDPPYTMRVSSHRVLFLKFLSSYNICIIINLPVIEACLPACKSYYCYVFLFFFHSKNPADVIKNIFDSVSIYLLTSRRNKGT